MYKNKKQKNISIKGNSCRENEPTIFVVNVYLEKEKSVPVTDLWGNKYFETIF